MPNLPQIDERRHILFVDDEPAFLDLIGELFTKWSNGHWEVHRANSTAKALAALQQYRFHLASIDLFMPIVDGAQFLQLLNRKYPQLQKVILTGYASDEARATCLNNGAELFLEKPRSAEGFESVFATLNELASWQPQEGFRGLLRQVGLQDVLQMECLGRNSSLLEISTPKARGRIFIHNGSIVHAEASEKSGEEAFNFLLGLRGGEFNLKPFTEPPRQTIKGQWEFLLMEASRLRDEAAGEIALTNEAATVLAAESIAALVADVPALLDTKALGRQLQASPLSPRCVPGNAPEHPELPEHAESDRISEEPVEPTATDPAANDAATAQDDSGQESASSGYQPPMREAPQLRPARIEEVLVCSPQGDVLYEWQCDAIATRRKLFELIAKKSGLASQALTLGTLDRVEILGPEGRIVTQVHIDRHLFVRSIPLANPTVTPAATPAQPA